MKILIIFISLIVFTDASAQTSPPPPPPRKGKKVPPPAPPGSPHRKIVAKKKKPVESKGKGRVQPTVLKEMKRKIEEVPPLEEVQEVKVPIQDDKIIKMEVPVKEVKKKKKKATVVKKKKRKPTSVTAKKFKGGMHKFKKKCVMHKSPDRSSPAAGSVKLGKKLWIDAHSSDWRKAYKKSGTVYVHRDCF